MNHIIELYTAKGQLERIIEDSEHGKEAAISNNDTDLAMKYHESIAANQHTLGRVVSEILKIESESRIKPGDVAALIGYILLFAGALALIMAIFG